MRHKRKSYEERILFDVKYALRQVFGKSLKPSVIERAVMLAKDDPGGNYPDAIVIINHTLGIPSPEEEFNRGSIRYDVLAQVLADVDDIGLLEVSDSITAVVPTARMNRRSRRAAPRRRR